MRARSLLIATAALALAGTQAPATAQGAAAPPASAAKTPVPTKEQLEDAAFEMRVLISAMGSDKVEAPVKDALFQCLYQNNFGKISDAVAKVIAQNPNKIAKRDPDQILGVLAGICGYRPKEAAATPAPGTPAKPAAPAKPAGPTTQGR